MESVKYILGQPEQVQGVGDIYPIKLKDYDEFMKYAGVLQISKNHIPKEYDDMSLFSYIVQHGLQDSEFMLALENLFSLLTKRKFKFITDGEQFGFISDNEENVIVNQNYEDIRKTVMRQNLIFEKKVFKDKMVEEWAEQVLKARRKNAVKMTIEDIVSTVSVYSGIDYEKLSEYTLYQLNYSFNRVSKIKSYESNVSFKCAGAEKVKLDHFAEEINLFKNPYDDLFVGKDKLSNINSVFGDKAN